MISKVTIRKIKEKIKKEKGYKPISIHEDELLNFSIGMGVYLYWFNSSNSSTHVIECTELLTDIEKDIINSHLIYCSERGI